jgi:hypothetical protein
MSVYQESFLGFRSKEEREKRREARRQRREKRREMRMRRKEARTRRLEAKAENQALDNQAKQVQIGLSSGLAQQELQSTQGTETLNQNPTQPQPRNTMLIAGIGAGVLVLALVLFLVFRKKEG